MCEDCGGAIRNSGVAVDCDCGQIGAIGETRRQRVFPSIMDWLDDEVPIEWLADFLKLIHDTPNLDWLLLSKRPEKWHSAMLAISHGNNRDAGVFAATWLRGYAPDSVWLGTSVEDQERADERIPELLKIPAKVRFLSVEPLLEAIRFSSGCHCGKPLCFDTTHRERGIHWVIVGSESGTNRRPMATEWALSIKEQCQSAGVEFFMKQMEVNGKVTGDIRSFPEDLRIREFPKI